jgi:hypothetical protein
MLPPKPGTWTVAASITGTKPHIEHVADDDGGQGPGAA